MKWYRLINKNNTFINKLIYQNQLINRVYKNKEIIFGSQCSKYYTITFLNDDGTVIEIKKYQYDNVVSPPQNPTKESDKIYNYTFLNWDKEITPCRGDATYIAIYSKEYINYTISFLNDDSSLISKVTYHYGDQINDIIHPTKTSDKIYSYEFSNWDKDLGICVGNTSFTAVYKATYIEYLVQFLNWDDSIILSKTYHYNTTVEFPPNPTRDPDELYTYTFSKWDNSATIVTDNLTYKAVYTVIKKPLIEEVGSISVEFANIRKLIYDKKTEYFYMISFNQGDWSKLQKSKDGLTWETILTFEASKYLTDIALNSALGELYLYGYNKAISVDLNTLSTSQSSPTFDFTGLITTRKDGADAVITSWKSDYTDLQILNGKNYYLIASSESNSVCTFYDSSTNFVYFIRDNKLRYFDIINAKDYDIFKLPTTSNAWIRGDLKSDTEGVFFADNSEEVLILNGPIRESSSWSTTNIGVSFNYINNVVFGTKLYLITPGPGSVSSDVIICKNGVFEENFTTLTKADIWSDCSFGNGVFVLVGQNYIEVIKES